MCAISSLFLSRFSILDVLELYIGGYDLCALHFQLGADTRTMYEIGGNFVIRIVGQWFFLTSDNFFYKFINFNDKMIDFKLF